MPCVNIEEAVQNNYQRIASHSADGSVERSLIVVVEHLCKFNERERSTHRTVIKALQTYGSKQYFWRCIAPFFVSSKLEASCHANRCDKQRKQILGVKKMIVSRITPMLQNAVQKAPERRTFGDTTRFVCPLNL